MGRPEVWMEEPARRRTDMPEEPDWRRKLVEEVDPTPDRGPRIISTDPAVADPDGTPGKPLPSVLSTGPARDSREVAPAPRPVPKADPGAAKGRGKGSGKGKKNPGQTPATKPEAKPDSDGGGKPDAKPEAKPEQKPDRKPEGKPSKPEPKKPKNPTPGAGA